MTLEFSELEEQYGDFYTPQFKLELGRKEETEIREFDGLISGLSVESSLNAASRFSFTLVDTFDLERKEFHEPVLKHFKPDTPVKISLGYGAPFIPVLDGRIQSLQPNFPASGTPTVEVSGYDRLHELSKGTNTQSWTGKSLKKVIEGITKEDETGKNAFDRRVIEDLSLTEPLPKIDQEKTSHLDFLLKQADRYNFEVFTRIDPDPSDETERKQYVETFYFRPPVDGSEPVLTLRYGESLQSFSLEFNEAGQVGKVVKQGWDGRRKQKIDVSHPDETRSGASAGATETREAKTEAQSEAEAKLLATAEYEKLLQGRVTGSGEIVGLPNLRVGEVVRLKGLSSAFDKPYYLTSVTHNIGESGYTTSFGVRLSKNENIPLELFT